MDIYTEVKDKLRECYNNRKECAEKYNISLSWEFCDGYMTAEHDFLGVLSQVLNQPTEENEGISW